jgi:hypothetical protein
MLRVDSWVDSQNLRVIGIDSTLDSQNLRVIGLSRLLTRKIWESFSRFWLSGPTLDSDSDSDSQKSGVTAALVDPNPNSNAKQCSAVQPPRLLQFGFELGLGVHFMYVHMYVCTYIHISTCYYCMPLGLSLLLFITYYLLFIILLCPVVSSSLGREPAVKYVHMYIHMGNTCLLGLGLGEEVQNTE